MCVSPIRSRCAKPSRRRHVDRQLQPERDPRDLYQQQEKTVRRSARAPRHAPRPRPAGPGRSRQGCRPDVVGSFIYPFSEYATPQGGARQTARLPVRSGSLDQGSPRSAGGRGLSKRYQRFGLHGPRHRDLQTVVASDPGDAERGAERPMQPAHGGRIRYGSTTPQAGISTWRSGPSFGRCSIPPTRSVPGTARTARRTIRSGTTRSSRR